jgi:hypothetical protein
MNVQRLPGHWGKGQDLNIQELEEHMEIECSENLGYNGRQKGNIYVLFVLVLDSEKSCIDTSEEAWRQPLKAA